MTTPRTRKISSNSIGQHRICTPTLHRLLRLLAAFSQLFCMAPLPEASAGKWNFLRRFHYLYGFLILLHIYTLSWMQMIRTDPFLKTIIKISYFGDIMVNNLVSTLAVCSTFHNATLYSEIPEKFLQILQAIKCQQTAQHSAKWNSLFALCKELSFYSLFITFFTLFFLVCTYYMILLKFGAYQLPNFLINLKLGQYWLTLRFAKHIYESLNETLKARFRHFDLCGSSTCAQSELAVVIALNSQPLHDAEYSSRYTRECFQTHPSEHSDSEFLEQIRRLYTQMDALMGQLADVYGPIVLFNYFGAILAVAVNVFEFYQGFYRPVQLLSILLWQTLYMTRIFPVLNASNAVVEENCRTTHVLNALYITSQKMQQAINRFLLQLVVHEPVESAGGVVKLDLMLLTGILSAIAQWVMFLIQTDFSTVDYD